jgi:hypothetical protein
MRIIELLIPKDKHLNKRQADQHYHNTLFHNYGHAGEAFVRHIITDIPRYEDILRDEQERFDRIMGWDEQCKERFYSATIAAAMFGGIVGNQIGLFNIDVDRVRDVVTEQMSQSAQREQQFTESSTDLDAIIGGFISNHAGEFVVINRDGHPMGHFPNRASGRFDNRSKLLYMSVERFAEYCKEKNLNNDAMDRLVKESDKFIRSAPVNVAESTSSPAVRIMAYVLEWSSMDAFDGTDG